MQAAEQFLLHQQTLWLSSERSIFWQEQKTLIISDVHFGKTGHFRKSGIAVPQNVYKEDLQRLLSLLQYYKPEQLLVVGDLFHSTANKELDLFTRWRNDISSLHINLVKGNHDILKTDWYTSANITVTTGHYALNTFCFVHDIADTCEPGKQINYYFSGHIHPSVVIKGTGKQTLSFPCFYFGKEFAVLPAFGKFTGTAQIDPKQGEHIFAILPPNLKKGESAALVKLQ